MLFKTTGSLIALISLNFQRKLAAFLIHSQSAFIFLAYNLGPWIQVGVLLCDFLGSQPSLLYSVPVWSTLLRSLYSVV